MSSSSNSHESRASAEDATTTKHRLSRFKVVAPEKSIGFYVSIAFIINNISGPGMLGLPQLFIQAGIIPTITTIVLVCVSSSFCGTFLADSIAFIPGNRKFQRPIDFPSAFYVIAGEYWYILAEILFLVSCMVQACAALAETAQSLDGFLASFLIGKTYAVELNPLSVSLNLLEWSQDTCLRENYFHDLNYVNQHNSTSHDHISDMYSYACTPFKNSGAFVLSLGYIITTILFLPLGLANLKETMIVQLISFALLILLLVQFYGVFVFKGFNYASNLSWFGTDWSQLIGVVMFNFAYSITVPSWLSEKNDDVSVNKVIWISTTASALIYATFGLFAAMAFEDVGANILVILASSEVTGMPLSYFKHVGYFTRISAAVFGISIIGCSVPVFCIIIKNTLYSSGLCGEISSFIYGAFVPYAVSWMLYQGTAVIDMLNYTGLIVNGLVAFVMPLILTSCTLKTRKRYAEEYERLTSPDLIHEADSPRIVSMTSNGNYLDSNHHHIMSRRISPKNHSADKRADSPTIISTKKFDDGFEMVQTSTTSSSSSKSYEIYRGGYGTDSSNEGTDEEDNDPMRSSLSHRKDSSASETSLIPSNVPQNQDWQGNRVTSWQRIVQIYHSFYPKLYRQFSKDSNDDLHGRDIHSNDMRSDDIYSLDLRNREQIVYSHYHPTNTDDQVDLLNDFDLENVDLNDGVLSPFNISPKQGTLSDLYTISTDIDDFDYVLEDIRIIQGQAKDQRGSNGSSPRGISPLSTKNEDEVPLVLAEEGAAHLHGNELKRITRLQTLERRLASVIAPLPSFLESYYGVITYTLIAGFVLAIVLTVIVDLYTVNSADD